MLAATHPYLKSAESPYIDAASPDGRYSELDGSPSGCVPSLSHIKKKLVAERENDRANEEADDARSHKAAYCANEDDKHRNVDSTTHQEGFKKGITYSDEDTPDRDNCGNGTGGGEHVDNNRAQDQNSGKLNHSKNQQEQGPKPRARHADYEKASPARSVWISATPRIPRANTYFFEP
jgi:hypothetical protein